MPEIRRVSGILAGTKSVIMACRQRRRNDRPGSGATDGCGRRGHAADRRSTVREIWSPSSRTSTASCARCDSARPSSGRGRDRNEMGKLTSDTHNEMVLMAGSLGVSSLVCLLNNGDNGRPKRRNPCSGRSGACTRRASATAAQSSARRRPARRCSPTAAAGPAGQPVAGAEVDIWHLRRGPVREPGPRPGRHEPARQVHDRRRGRIRFRSSSPPATRSRPTAWSAGCSERRTATPSARRISTAWSSSRATRR